MLFRWTNQMADTELPLEDIFQMFGELTEYVLGLIDKRRAGCSACRSRSSLDTTESDRRMYSSRELRRSFIPSYL